MYKTKNYYRRKLRLAGLLFLIIAIFSYGYYKTYWKPNMEQSKEIIFESMEEIFDYYREHGLPEIKEYVPTPERKPIN